MTLVTECVEQGNGNDFAIATEKFFSCDKGSRLASWDYDVLAYEQYSKVSENDDLAITG